MMVSQQNDWGDDNRKRSREDEYEDIVIGGTLGFTEHRSKRLQSLPLRTSPTSKRLSGPPTIPTSFNPLPAVAHTITPADSDSEEAGNKQRLHEEQPIAHLSPWSSSPTDTTQPSSFVVAETVDSDMEMGDSTTIPDPQQSSTPGLLEPGPFQPDPISSSIAGRMPTPIHCSFAQQVRGNNWSGAAGHIMHTASNTAPFSEGTARSDPAFGGVLESYRDAGMVEDQSVPRALDGPAATAAVLADWSLVQNRRLPSPISESGGEDGTRSPASPGMVLDSSPHLNRHGHHHPALASLPPRSSSAMELSHAHPLRESSPNPMPPNSGGSGSAMDIEPTSPATPSPRKGHTRSRHTLNSWTLQPGMKKSFSIGYRADCEKCRLKVPGHFNHIIIS